MPRNASTAFFQSVFSILHQSTDYFTWVQFFDTFLFLPVYLPLIPFQHVDILTTIKNLPCLYFGLDATLHKIFFINQQNNCTDHGTGKKNWTAADSGIQRRNH